MNIFNRYRELKMKFTKQIVMLFFVVVMGMRICYADEYAPELRNVRIDSNDKYKKIAYEARKKEIDLDVESTWIYMKWKDTELAAKEGMYESIVAEKERYYTIDWEKSLVIYPLSNTRYALQYAQYNSLDYLFRDPRLAISMKVICDYDTRGQRIGQEQGNVLDKTIDNLHKFDEIKEQLKNVNAGKIEDCKLVTPYSLGILLYIKCENGTYGVFLDRGNTRYFDITEFDTMKVYPAESILSIIAQNESAFAWTKRYNISQICDIKNQYTTEAQVLEAKGLLKGNENGLDLLKPLTRAESVAILIRALGLEEETSQYSTSMFSDISSDNWASPYAALAKERGITTGVTETEFAPDRQVTVDQFATFVLRAAGERDIDYTQGTQILIDRGIITTEQAQTMDLFTRGDMAKIIYEAREKGLL